MFSTCILILFLFFRESPNRSSTPGSTRTRGHSQDSQNKNPNHNHVPTNVIQNSAVKALINVVRRGMEKFIVNGSDIEDVSDTHFISVTHFKF